MPSRSSRRSGSSTRGPRAEAGARSLRPRPATVARSPPPSRAAPRAKHRRRRRPHRSRRSLPRKNPPARPRSPNDPPTSEPPSEPPNDRPNDRHLAKRDGRAYVGEQASFSRGLHFRESPQTKPSFPSKDDLLAFI